MIPLAPPTRARVLALFREADVDTAERLLVDTCARNLPLSTNATADELERIRSAAIRFSGGRLGKLRAAIELAQLDWRDLLVCAGFAEDVDAHTHWKPARFDDDVSDRWMAGHHPLGVSFALNQLVHLQPSTGAGCSGAVIGLLGLEPEPCYLVELGTGQDVEVFQRFLRAAD